MGMISEFKDFAMKGNVVDMAVGVVIGGAFGKIVTSLVNDIIMPSVGVLTGGVDFADKKKVIQEEILGADGAVETAGVSINWGVTVNMIINFLIVAFAIFIVVKILNSAKKKEEAKPAAPPAQEVLLGEIRDLLKK